MVFMHAEKLEDDEEPGPECAACGQCHSLCERPAVAHHPERHPAVRLCILPSSGEVPQHVERNPALQSTISVNNGVIREKTWKLLLICLREHWQGRLH